MRFLGLLVVLGAVAVACSSSGDASDPGSSSGGTSGDDGADGGGEGGPGIVTGTQGDHALSIAPVNDAQTIVQGTATTVPIVLTRGKDLDGSLTITITGFTNGLTAAPLTITGTTGDLVLSSEVGKTQGDAQGMIVATNGAQTAMTPLKASVRGAPGALDTTWGTNGQVLTSDPAQNLATRFLLLGASGDDVYSISSKPSSGSVFHLDARGVLDTTFGTAGVSMLDAILVNDAALTPGGNIVLYGGLDVPHTGQITIDQIAATGKGATYFVSSVPTPFSDYAAGAYAVAVRGDNHVFFAWDNPTGAQVDCGTAHLDELGFPVDTYGNNGFERASVSRAIGAFFQSSAVSEPFNVVSIGSGTVFYQRFASATGAVIAGFETGKPVALAGVARADAGPQGLVMLADKSVVAPFYSSGGIALIKFDADGNPAAGFGTNGIAGPYLIPDTGAPTGIAVDNTGKFVVALDRGGLLRFTSTGALDADFGTAGKAPTPGVGGNQLHRKVVVQKTSARILATGPGTSDAAAMVTAYWP